MLKSVSKFVGGSTSSVEHPNRKEVFLHKVKIFKVDHFSCFLGSLAILDLDLDPKQEQYTLTKMNKEYTEKWDQEHNEKNGSTT